MLHSTQILTSAVTVVRKIDHVHSINLSNHRPKHLFFSFYLRHYLNVLNFWYGGTSEIEPTHNIHESTQFSPSSSCSDEVAPDFVIILMSSNVLMRHCLWEWNPYGAHQLSHLSIVIRAPAASAKLQSKKVLMNYWKVTRAN